MDISVFTWNRYVIILILNSLIFLNDLNNKIMEKTSLYYKSEGSDKVYYVTLDGGTVTVQYGRRGNALTSLIKCQNCAPEKALKVYYQLINEKKAKGYHEGEAGVAYSSVADPNQTGYVPQLLNEIDEDTANQLIQNAGWLMQEKEDGRNIGIIFRNHTAIAANKKGISIPIPEDIIQSVESTAGCNMTLCGELIGDIFKVWDIIECDLIPSNARCLKRYEELRSFVKDIRGRNSVNIQLTKTAITQEEKIALFKEMKEKNAEGVVFKRKGSLYKPGRPASGGDQLKYKFTATCSVIAGEQRKEGKRSVEMWLYDGLHKVFVGNVTIYPNQEIPKPLDIIEVRYLYAFKEGSLFQPVFLGVRDDVENYECTISQLKYKRELAEEE
jgi:bifunctional non-homologous end joining protein LigD